MMTKILMYSSLAIAMGDCPEDSAKICPKGCNNIHGICTENEEIDEEGHEIRWCRSVYDCKDFEECLMEEGNNPKSPLLGTCKDCSILHQDYVTGEILSEHNFLTYHECWKECRKSAECKFWIHKRTDYPHECKLMKRQPANSVMKSSSFTRSGAPFCREEEKRIQRNRLSEAENDDEQYRILRNRMIQTCAKNIDCMVSENEEECISESLWICQWDQAEEEEDQDEEETLRKMLKRASNSTVLPCAGNNDCPADGRCIEQDKGICKDLMSVKTLSDGNSSMKSVTIVIGVAFAVAVIVAVFLFFVL